MGVESRQYEGIKCLTCKEKDKKKREKKMYLLYIKVFMCPISSKTPMNVSIFRVEAWIAGYIYSKYSDPVEPEILLLLNVRHTRRKTANQI